jgi:hypothetical protein
MKYMLLVYRDENAFDASELTPYRDESVRLAHDLHAAGKYFGAAPLHPISTATSVRIVDGKRVVTDGPFAETREQLGGYFLVEARDQNEAIEIAARIPGARLGTVEVRPVLEIDGLPERG